MAFYDGHNYPYVRNAEIYDYRQIHMPFRMDEPEIHERPEPEVYRDMDGYYDGNGNYHYRTNRYYNQEVPQFYFNDDHDNDRRNYDDRSYREIYTPGQIPFNPMHREELPQDEISVPIHLSSTRNVGSLISALAGYSVGCHLEGHVLTVTGTIAFGAANDFLTLVRRLSGDRGAYIVR